MSLFPFTIGGLTDSMNPCGLTILVFFVTGFLSLGKFPQVRRKDVFFVAALFLTKFFMLMGFLEAFRISPAFFFIGRIVYLLLALAALVLAGIHMRDWWIYKKTNSLETLKIALPVDVKDAMGLEGAHKSGKTPTRWAGAGLSFLSILLGVLMGFLGSICPEPDYVTTLVYTSIVQRQLLQAFLGLLLYNLGSMIPLLMMWALTAWMTRSRKFRLFLNEHIALFKITCSAVLFAVGVGLIYTFF